MVGLLRICEYVLRFCNTGGFKRLIAMLITRENQIHNSYDDNNNGDNNNNNNNKLILFELCGSQITH